jgi:hypothetical protein
VVYRSEQLGLHRASRRVDGLGGLCQTREPGLDLRPHRGEIWNADPLMRAQVLQHGGAARIRMDHERVSVHLFVPWRPTFTVL